MSTINERRYVRVKCLTPASFEYRGNSYEGTMRDVSLCGTFVLSPLPVEMDEKVKIETKLPECEPVTLRGRIVRIVLPNRITQDPVTDTQAGFGVDFGAVPLATREAIDGYVRLMFRTFRKLQFELSRADVSQDAIQELLHQTYLPKRSYSVDALKDLVAAELKGFRLRPV